MTELEHVGRRRLGRSRLGGAPTVLPPENAHSERQLPLLAETAAPSERRELLPGVVRIGGWLDFTAQRALAAEFRRWAEPPAGLRHPRMPTGHLMTVQSVCLGWHWYPYVYSKTADDTDGTPVKPLPRSLFDLGRAAVAAAYGAASRAAQGYAPDAAIVNLYTPSARLGLHQDAEEPSDAPVVTISLGDTCMFRMAGVKTRNAPFCDVPLASGDLLVFGGVNRRIYHGVPKVLEGTGPAGLGLPPGRLSLTLRETGFPERGRSLRK